MLVRPRGLREVNGSSERECEVGECRQCENLKTVRINSCKFRVTQPCGNPFSTPTTVRQAAVAAGRRLAFHSSEAYVSCDTLDVSRDPRRERDMRRLRLVFVDGFVDEQIDATTDANAAGKRPRAVEVNEETP